MCILDVLLGRPSTRAVTVYNYEGQDLGIPGDLLVNGRKREVALFRPPMVLGPGGENLPGVDRQLVADYLVSTTGMLAEVDLGPARVDWKARVGRFADVSPLPQIGHQALKHHPFPSMSQQPFPEVT